MNNWKRNLYAIWIAEFIALAGFSTSIPIIPFYLQDLGITDPDKLKMWVGLCQAGASITLALFAPIWGKLADSYGRKMMLIRAFFGGTMVMVLLGFARQPMHVLILRLLQGTLTGTVAAGTVLVASIVPKEHAGYGLGILQMSIFLGASTGPMIGGLISDNLGHRATFFTTSALLLIGGLIILFLVNEEFTPINKPGKFLENFIPDFSALKTTKELAVLIFASASVQMANNASTPTLPLYVQSMVGISERVASITGLILGAAAFASAFAAAAIGRFSYKFGYRRTLLFCLIGAACLLIPQGLAHTPHTLLIFRVLAGICLGGTMPSINAMIAVRVKKGEQGSIYGLTASFNAGGSAMGPVIGSAIAVVSGYAATFFGSAFILITAFGIVFIMTRKFSDGSVQKVS